VHAHVLVKNVGLLFMGHNVDVMMNCVDWQLGGSTAKFRMFICRWRW